MEDTGEIVQAERGADIFGCDADTGKMNWRNINNLNATILQNLPRLRGVAADCVVGIPRSGMLAGAIAALHLNLPLANPDSIARNEMWWRNATCNADSKRILLIDDSLNTGGAMQRAAQAVGYNAVDIVRCAVYGRSDSVALGRAEIVLEAVNGKRVFEWNLWKHLVLTRCIVDIDGVLCRDPTAEENDDGPNYRKFMESVEVWRVPYHPIGWICTTRLEKYRSITEEWLRRNNIKYGHLVMLNLPDQRTRLVSGGRAEFKAKVYSKLHEALIFIESDQRYAPAIARISGKPVICTETQHIYD